MDLFDYMRETAKEKESPLASRMRPTTLEEVVGQQHIIGKGKLLYRAIKADKLSSLIFYGPPGTGKTTLAKVIANTTSAEFKQINATVAGKKDMEEVVKAAKDLQGMYGKKTILFIDEIHRFNKGQQDYLLPFVEDGTLILIGATTENPYFEVNGALISRSSIFELKPLEKEDIKKLLVRAVEDTEKGMGSFHAQIDPDALEFLADVSGGDARNALNAVELGILTTDRSSDGIIHLTLEVASECIQKRECRHNLGYWDRVEYLGIGAGASSLLRNRRFSHIRNRKTYIEAIHEKQPIETEEELLSEESQMEEFMYLGLRKVNGISKEKFERTFQKPISEVYGTVIEHFQAEHLLECKGDRIFLSRRGMDVSNYVLAEFLLGE